jgi:hypothetical protein
MLVAALVGKLLERADGNISEWVIDGGAISHVDENYAIPNHRPWTISQQGSMAQSLILLHKIYSQFTVSQTVKNVGY